MRAILTYHAIDPSGSPISIDPTVFHEHARWFEDGHARVLPLDDLVGRRNSTEASADRIDELAITFDDAFINSGDAMRRLLDAGLPVAMFVVSRHAGRDNAWGGQGDPGIPVMPLLDWDAIGDLASRGATVGAHTCTHPRLATLALPAATAEIENCISDIRDRLGFDPRFFAYPYGSIDAHVQAAAASRFSAAVTTRFAALSASDATAALPRLDMYYFREPGAIATLARPGIAARLRMIRWRRRLRETLA